MKSFAQQLDDVEALDVVRSEAAPLPWRIASVRFFDGNIHRLLALGLLEAAVVMASLAAASALGLPEKTAEGGSTTSPAWRSIVIGTVMLGGLASMGLYQLRHRASLPGVVVRLLIGVLIALAGLGLISYLAPSPFVGRDVLAMTGAFSFCVLVLVRWGFLRLVDEDLFKRRVLVWGAGARAASISRMLRRRTDQRGFKIVGYVGSAGENAEVPAPELLAPDGDLMRFILSNRVEEIVVAMDDRRRGFPEAFLRRCRLQGVAVRDVVTFLERESGRVCVELAKPSWLIYSEGFRCDLFRRAMKRLFDLSVATVVLVASAPIALLAALAIYLEDRGPIFYSQARVGRGGRVFNMIKFRSMAADAEHDGRAVWAVRNDPRTTRVGAFIRKLRIDELPQVLNVLSGHMSFVGPRPERPMFVEALSSAIPFYAERHYVKPGITGWAQVRYPYGASESDAREKLGYDLYYVANNTLVFDVMVLLQTVEVVLLRTGSR